MNSSYSFFDAKLAERLSAFPLFARGAMLGSVSGQHQSPHRGSSVEFAEYRRYQPGDDLRRLDWRAYGRSDRYFVKEFEADTNLRLILVVDCSGSMAFGTKLEAARQISALLAYLAIGQGDAAGLAAVGETETHRVPARRNATQVSVLFDALANLQPAGTTGLCGYLHELAESIRQRAKVIVISDLLFEPVELRSSLEHLRHSNHDVSLMHLMDPRELSPDWTRPVRLEDMEGGEAMMVDPDEISAGYEAAVEAYLEEVETVSRESSAHYCRAILDQPLEGVLTEFLANANQSGSGR